MDRDDLRAGVESADDTGMIAGEELITQAETVAPSEAPAFPGEELHASLPEQHEQHTTITRLRDEMASPQPNREAIERHVQTLRGLPELEATVATWWESPATQRFIANLSQIGL
ncbi:MAG: hypothetical protein JO078_07270 [Candidatus Eremiobacteraeota bacterium]|nr:hypothetical protein [Candidatus Eremiobacteraeota bacterium]MBV9057093.1 hypothetical protein [Candidatus Eremiobacteraeota bacterium]MBV9699909.1 hypothetical protein [Candidatus Eremiobacteraeota bacterium]